MYFLIEIYGLDRKSGKHLQHSLVRMSMPRTLPTPSRLCVITFSLCGLLTILYSKYLTGVLQYGNEISQDETAHIELLNGIEEPTRPWKHLVTREMLSTTLYVTGKEFKDENLLIFVSHVNQTTPKYLLVDLINHGVTLRVSASGAAHTASTDCHETFPGKYTCRIPLIDPGKYDIIVKLMLFGISEARIRDNIYPNGVPNSTDTYSGTLGHVALPIVNGTFSMTQQADFARHNTPWCEFDGFLPGRWDSSLKEYRPFDCKLPLYTPDMITRWVEASPSKIFIRIQGDSLFKQIFHFLASVLECEKHKGKDFFLCFTSKVVIIYETYFVHGKVNWPLRVGDLGTMLEEPRCKLGGGVLERLPSGWKSLTPNITFNYFGDHFSNFNRTTVPFATAEYMQVIEAIPFPLVTSIGSPSNLVNIIKYPNIYTRGTPAFQSDQHMYQLNEHLIEAYHQYCGSCLGIVDSYSPIFSAVEIFLTGDVIHPTSEEPIAYWLYMQLHAFFGTPYILKLLDSV